MRPCVIDIRPQEGSTGKASSRICPRLLYLVRRAERGGAQMHVLELALAMRADFEVHVATGEEGFLTKACRDASIPVHILPHLQREINPLADARAWFEVHRLLVNTRPDLLHVHTWKSGLLGRLAARVAGIPVVYTVHMWPFGRNVPRLWRLFGPSIERLLAVCCQRLITVSQAAAVIGRKYRITDPSRIATIENGIGDRPERAHLTSGSPPVIAMVARFFPPKDHSTLLHAFSRLGDRARLVLIGDGPKLAEAKTLAQRLGIHKFVSFIGNRDDVPILLMGIDIFVLSSMIEDCPISIIEAMRAGLPVIAPRVGGIPDLVINGQTGLLFEAGSASELQAALDLLIRDATMRKRFGQEGRTRYERKFRSAIMCSKTYSVYKDVLAEATQQRVVSEKGRRAELATKFTVGQDL